MSGLLLPSTATTRSDFEVIPALDLLGGSAVRLRQGDFSAATVYGDPLEILASSKLRPGSRLHVVDLEGARRGAPVERELIVSLCRSRARIQLGGGIRTAAQAEEWLRLGVWKVVIGTAAAEPRSLARIVSAIGAERILPAIDVRDGRIRVSGWTEDVSMKLFELLRRIEELGIGEVMVTDIARDGMLAGPSFDLIRELGGATRLRIIASGGIATLGDVAALARLDGCSGAIIGRALLDGSFSLAQASGRAAIARNFAIRVIPCLDTRGGRVVKGVRFESLRDAGDPVECARRYEDEGADELVVLDVSATAEQRSASLETVRRIAGSIFVPLTVGGGVRSVEDFRTLLQAGADRVAINTAAVQRPELIAEVAVEFGTQAVVVACDARRGADRYDVFVRSGSKPAELGAADWCAQAEALGAGEVLLTSIDADGTRAGYDIELLRAVSARLRIGVIASGGAGDLSHFHEAIESGGASAVLGASLFHDRQLTIAEVKNYLAGRGVPVRR